MLHLSNNNKKRTRKGKKIFETIKQLDYLKSSQRSSTTFESGLKQTNAKCTVKCRWPLAVGAQNLKPGECAG